ncbi:hypothetical protein [Myroides indicus]|uniref:Uncharacterized protein n=1 Tax=Myroides indicus TaxID=1323422 RepID=A0A4R7EM08_9FLAO|nr:hypothetical protein [Myroides indicus]TDS51434.1 hypothetical protein C8P70_1385 [Myroides indicus]
MRRLLLIGGILFTLNVNAQQENTKDKAELGGRGISELLEKKDYYGLSEEQVEKIKQTKERLAKEFRAIGQDNSLSGKEKGLKKKTLAQNFKNDINKILSQEQQTLWMSEQMNRKINKSAQKGIDYKLELLELEHESNLKYLEKNSKDKETLKSKKEELNAKYKSEKEDLEKQKSLL